MTEVEKAANSYANLNDSPMASRAEAIVQELERKAFLAGAAWQRANVGTSTSSVGTLTTIVGSSGSKFVGCEHYFEQSPDHADWWQCIRCRYSEPKQSATDTRTPDEKRWDELHPNGALCSFEYCRCRQ